MVTRVHNNAGLLYSPNFAPRQIAGLVITHSGGAVTGVGAVKETAAGTISVPANTIWTVYANLTTGLLVAAATSTVPTTNALPLWHGVSTSNSTTLIDVRSWSSTMLQVNPANRGFNQYLVEELNLIHDWRLNEVNLDNSHQDDGSGTDMGVIGSNVYTSGHTGDVSYETDTAVRIDGAGGGLRDTNLGSPMTDVTQGCFGIVTKTDDIAGGPLWAALGDNNVNGQFNFLMFGPWTSNSVRYQIVSQAGNTLQVISQLIGIDFEDDLYHMIHWDQAGDAGGVKCFIDGDLATNITETYAGTADEDSWFPASPRTTVWTIGAAAFGANNQLDGDISRVWVSDDSLSAAQHSTLNDARTGLVV